MKGVFLFESTHRVLKAEKVIKEGRIGMKLIPVPRTLTSDCGLAIRIDHGDMGKALVTLKNGRALPKEYYVKDGDEYSRFDIGNL